jgi:CDP-diacylglycerol--serine O-phosphatidyltransferase
MNAHRSLIPNVMTVTNLFLGFVAVLLVFDGRLITAAWLIIAAGVLDALDGKLARFINGQSDFGMELDSLADLLSFGVAPAVLLYKAYFQQLHVLGILLAFFPILFCAVRLAKYNVSVILPEEHLEFTGLPTPIQASVVVSYIIFNVSIWGHLRYGLYLTPLVILTSLLMVSTVPYDAFPRLSFRGSWRNRVNLILLLLGLVLVLYKPPLMVFPVVMCYVVVGGIKGLIVMRARELETLQEVKEVEEEHWAG